MSARSKTTLMQDVREHAVEVFAFGEPLRFRQLDHSSVLANPLLARH